MFRRLLSYSAASSWREWVSYLLLSIAALLASAHSAARAFMRAPLPPSVVRCALWAAALLAPGTALADAASTGSVTFSHFELGMLAGLGTLGTAIVWVAVHFGKQIGDAAGGAVDKAVDGIVADLKKNAQLAAHPAELASLQEVVRFIGGVVKSTIIETIADISTGTLDWKKIAKDSLSTIMGQINQQAVIGILQRAGVLAPGASLEGWVRAQIANELHEVAKNKGGLLGHLLDDAADEVEPPAPPPSAAQVLRDEGGIAGSAKS